MSQTGLRRTLGLGLISALALGAAAGRAHAQVRDDGRRLYREQLRVELDKQQAAARRIGIDAGGWLSCGIFDYDDDADRKVRTLRQYELRLWASYTHAGVHNAYVRGLIGYDDWNSGDNSGGHGDEFTAPELERAWYRFDYNRLIRNRTGQDPKVGFAFEVGRNYHEIGSGLVLALPLDAVRFTGNAENWQLTALVGMTVKDTPNIDDSAAVDDEMDRCFYGLEVRYSGFDRHEPYAYVLWQTDHTDESPRDPWQEYDYDTNYVGIGSGGSLLVPNLRYACELAFEFGRGFPDAATRRREDVRAMALDVLLEYFFQAPTHPKLSLEYLWGSGDADRRLSGTSTVGGNLAGTDDQAFNAFGFRDTGLAFAPRIANLHVFELGLSAMPLEHVALFRKMELGAKAYLYAKHKGSGAISDMDGAGHSNWVGWEWDLFCNWRVTSDVSMTVRYGVFQPGDAFGYSDSRHFVYAGVTYSF